MSAEVLVRGRVSEILPQCDIDGSREGEPVRIGRYNEQYALSLIPTKHLLASEGSYFVAGNPTPGTGIAMTISTAFSDTVAMFAIKNTDSRSNRASKRIYLD